MNYESQREKSDKRVHMASLILQIFAGLLIFAVGIIMFKKDHFNIAQIVEFTSDRDPFLMQMFGGICMLYGAWRVYRGYLTYKNS